VRRLLSRLILPLVMCFAGHAAFAAEPSATSATQERPAVISIGQPHHVPTALDSVPHPWPGVALSLSAAGLAVPIVLAGSWSKTQSGAMPLMVALAAEVLTPSAGHLYAGLTHRAAIGVLARGMAFGVAAAGAASAGLWTNNGPSDWTPALLVVLIGATTEAALAVVDVVTVASDVQRSNDDWLTGHTLLGVRMLPDGSAPAVALTIRF
jgi:hypothetical protein